MPGDSLATVMGEQPASEGSVAPKLHPSRLRRSRLASNPMAALQLNTARGRLIHDTAARLLVGVADPADPLTISDCLALAELRVRADELRRDPASDPNVVIKPEGLIDRRMRRLGLDRRNREPAAAPSFADIAAQAQADAARRRAHELAADTADDEGGTAPGQGANDERPTRRAGPNADESACF